MEEGDKIISLFSGCGGLDLGFKKAGYDIVFATDYAEFLKETYDENHETELEVEDIRELDYDSLPDCDGIIGGPPCQSWSLAGNHLRGSEDERGAVFYNYIEIIEHKKPKFFVAENVPGIISKSNIEEFKEIIEKFKEIGYDVKYKKMNASYYGVPQERKRVIIVGIREDIDFDYEFPEGSDEKMGQEVLRGMPESKPTEGEPHDLEDLELPNHEHYVGGYSSRYMSRNRVRSWDEPAYTVQANARHQKIHPKAPKMTKIEKDNWKFKEGHEDKYRRYSIREAAKLQTFPDDFNLKYDKVRDGYKMIGNAVPVNLAKAVAESIQGNLRKEKATIKEFT
ncbi:MAG: DNA cytosine methyltransferase [Nanohaloarchaea archaeon]|nr:DNA cytosine methyltransferase [Candidatus Nanohaloarchaea archaeon]